MNARDILRRTVGFVLIGACAGLCGCKDERQSGPDTLARGGTTRVVVRLKVEYPGGKAATTRSPLDPDESRGEYGLGFTEAENQINSLTLVMMRTGASGQEIYEGSQTIPTPADADADGTYDAQFQLETDERGNKHFYLGANMDTRHIGAFHQPERVFDAGEGQSGHNIVGALMTVSHAGDGQGSDIVMSAPVTSGGGRDIEITRELEQTIAIDNPIRLTRTVSKVLLTCVPASGSTDHVNVTDQDERANGNGWMRLADVSYMLNVLNRKTYLDYRIEADDHLTDPNYAMSSLIERRTSGTETTYGLRDLAAYQREFLYYDTQAMVTMLNTDVQQAEGTTPERCLVRKATLYDDSRIGADHAASEDHYTEGLYCPENMVLKDLADIPDEDLASVCRLVTTHVMIGAKYTPKILWTGADAPVVAASEEEAQALLAEVTDPDNPLAPVTYLPGTFWRDGEGRYYTLAGMKRKLRENPDTEFSRYDGGWGYYYTYIDDDANPDGTIDYTRNDSWGTERNHYYILKVNKITAPGAAFPGNEAMRIHSELIDWVDKGLSEVEIDVPQNNENTEETQP